MGNGKCAAGNQAISTPGTVSNGEGFLGKWGKISRMGKDFSNCRFRKNLGILRLLTVFAEIKWGRISRFRRQYIEKSFPICYEALKILGFRHLPEGHFFSKWGKISRFFWQMRKDFSMKDFLMELSTNYQQVIHMLINKFIHNSKLLNGMRLRQNGTSVATTCRRVVTTCHRVATSCHPY